MFQSQTSLLAAVPALAASILLECDRGLVVSQIALAACLRNRIYAMAPASGVQFGTCEPDMWSLPAFLQENKRFEACEAVSFAALAQIIGNLCLLLSEDISDPTDGAIHFHRHDQWPEWAKRRSPTALIGSHFFYDDADLLNVPLRLGGQPLEL